MNTKLTLKEMSTIVTEIEYLRGEFDLSGDREGKVSIESMVEWLEKDSCYGIHVLEHLISVVKIKNGIK